jgi:hypothetical protein
VQPPNGVSILDSSNQPSSRSLLKEVQPRAAYSIESTHESRTPISGRPWRRSSAFSRVFPFGTVPLADARKSTQSAVMIPHPFWENDGPPFVHSPEPASIQLVYKVYEAYETFGSSFPCDTCLAHSTPVRAPTPVSALLLELSNRRGAMAGEICVFSVIVLYFHSSYVGRLLCTLPVPACCLNHPESFGDF